MTDRWEVERALRASGLPPLARLVTWALLSRADADTAMIPGQFSPSLTALASDTGLGRSSIAYYLNLLESGGWVTRLRDLERARAQKQPTRYRLHAPASPRAGLVQEPDQSQSRTSPCPGPALVRDTDLASPGAGHNQNTSRTKPDQKKPATADPYLSLPGFGEFWDTYPRKAAKRQAAKAYRGALNRAGRPDLIVKAAARYRDDPGRDPAYTKHPATWLNGDCWTDEPAPVRQPSGSSRRGDIDWDAAMARARARGQRPSTGDRAIIDGEALKAQLRGPAGEIQ